MSSPKVERIFEQARTLDHEERRELLDKLQRFTPVAETLTQEQSLDKALLDAGLMNAPPSRKITLEEYQTWEPLEIKGRPLSETIIEERR